MHDGIIADVNSHMAAVTNNITGLHIAYPVSHALESGGRMGKTHAECRIDRHYKSGTICSIGQTGTAVHIGIADILTGIAYHVTAADTGGKGRVLTAALIRLLIIVPLRAGIGIISIGITAGISLVVIISIRAGIRIAAFIRIVCSIVVGRSEERRVGTEGRL